ncbi:MAG: hypothetical protein ABH889_00320 [Candidatus Portnoybacteria bacterium]
MKAAYHKVDWTFENLMNLNPRLFDYGLLNQEVILKWFDLCDAGWTHSGNLTDPHAELTGGDCSNGYFDCPRVLRYPNLNEILAYQLSRELRKKGITHDKVDWVIGSPYADITFSYEVAKILKAIHGFTEKDPADPKGKNMVWRRMAIPAGANVLQIEELITTSGTFQKVQQAIKEGNPDSVNFLSEVGVLIHRPAELSVDYGDRKVIALVEKEIWKVPPEECHLCKAGSSRYKPKSHWKELTGKA